MRMCTSNLYIKPENSCTALKWWNREERVASSVAAIQTMPPQQISSRYCKISQPTMIVILHLSNGFNMEMFSQFLAQFFKGQTWNGVLANCRTKLRSLAVCPAITVNIWL